MSSALIGVIGVMAGALTTGGVQAFLIWRDRRTDAVASTRLLWAELRATVLALQEMLIIGEWNKLDPLHQLLEVWKRERRPISRAVTNNEFQELIAGIHQVGVMLSWQAKGKCFDDARDGIIRTAQYCIEGRVTAFVAGEPLARRIGHRRTMKTRGWGYQPDVPQDQARIPGVTFGEDFS